MDGERNLTHRNVRKFAKGLNLGDREAIYFENLVFCNQAKDKDEEEFFKNNLELARDKDDRVLLTRDQHEALAKWHPMAIKELVITKGFDPKPKRIAARLDYRITPQEAKEALELLERLGLIQIDRKNGKIRDTQQSMQTPDITRSNAVALYHKQMLDLAKESIDSQSGEERCLSALTVAIQKRDLVDAFQKIHQFRNEMDTFFTKRKPYDAVYQLNFQLYRLDTDVKK